MLINSRGRLLDLSSPLIMGILNVTPDSFYEDSRMNSSSQMLKKVEQMLRDGASILDIGGASSRPGAATVSVEEELKRVIPSIECIIKEFPEAFLSVDTYQSAVAKEAIQAGIHLVNDISASSMDEDLLDVVAESKLPYVLMHMQGKPQTMQSSPSYQEILTDVMDFFIEKLFLLKEKGIQDIILDVGFGFGKSIEHNYKLLSNLNIYETFERPMLVGLSRKSMIWKPLKTSPKNALNGTSALHMIALQQGAKILRVHDVQEAKECINLWQLVEEQA